MFVDFASEFRFSFTHLSVIGRIKVLFIKKNQKLGAIVGVSNHDRQNI